MSKINRDNYEAYLLDYAEGNLSEELQVELELFMIQNPELNIDLSELSLLAAEAVEVSYSDKQQLKRSESDLVSDTQFVAYIENQITPEEKAVIDKSCATNKTLAHELKLYQNTIALADATIVFPDKNKLKRQNKVIWLNFSSAQYSIAASVLLLLGLYILWPKQDYIGNIQQMAVNYSFVKPTITKSNILPNDVLIENKSQTNTLANNTPQHKVNSVVSTQTILVAENDFKKQENLNNLSNSAIENNVEENKSLIAANEAKNNTVENVSKTKTVVEVISESDEDVVVQQPKKKKSFWSLAEKALQNLNAIGVKSVNANQENSQKDNSSTYALTLGKVSVTHKSN